MQAIRTATITATERNDKLVFSIFDQTEEDLAAKTSSLTLDSDKKSESAEQAQARENHQEPSSSDGTASSRSKQSSLVKDPLKWFGILVPPTLRTAQSQFIAAVQGPLPQLATTLKEMRRMESEIGRLRKTIKKL